MTDTEAQPVDLIEIAARLAIVEQVSTTCFFLIAEELMARHGLGEAQAYVLDLRGKVLQRLESHGPAVAAAGAPLLDQTLAALLRSLEQAATPAIKN